MKIKVVFLLSGLIFVFSACGRETDVPKVEMNDNAIVIVKESSSPPVPSAVPKFPDLQSELLDENNEKTSSPIGSFDFKNYTYPLPRGWQDADGSEAVLENGVRRGGEKKIGLSYVTAKYFDATGDGEDEAFVILKILTSGSANPQSVYVFSWKDEKPELIWDFRTGDRSDGGLKNLRSENGQVVIELYGQDRYILGDAETLRITGDEEQICCPVFFTRSRYKWNGNSFRLEGRRETYSITDKDAAPQENLGDVVDEREKRKK